METLDGFSDKTIEEGFRLLRVPEYKQLLDSAVAVLQSIGEKDRESDSHQSDWRKLKRRFNEVRNIDFFGAPGREEIETIMQKIDTALQGRAHPPVAKPDLKSLIGKTWVTRKGVKVDRIASAWLIRRFIDSAARFRFVEPDRYTPSNGEVRFDMFEGEFMHEGGFCTFEVLLQHTGLRNAALDAIWSSTSSAGGPRYRA